MDLQNLPDEILMIIIKKLDPKSLSNLYAASERIRNIILTYGIIKTLNISLSVMAHAETLNSLFFKAISRNLQELDVSGVQDLTKTKFLPAVRRLKSLKILDITYTKICIPDLIDIYDACPTIKDISVNFSFGELKTLTAITNMIHAFQKLFENFLYVHFVGSNMIQTKLANVVLKKAQLKKLQYTVIPEYDSALHYSFNEKNILLFESFFIYFIDNGASLFSLPNNSHSYLRYVLETLYCYIDPSMYETLIIVIKKDLPMEIKNVKCYGSSTFKNFFASKSDVSFQLIEFDNGDKKSDINFYGDVYVMNWKKSTTFDQQFFIDLWCKLKPFIPYCFEATNTPVPPEHDFYITSSIPQEIQDLDNLKMGNKRRRIAPPSCVLNYDNAFREKRELQLFLIFGDFNYTIITLSPNCEYLKKLTFLALTGNMKYSTDFFNLLFRCCNKLITLIVNSHAINPSCAAIARSIPLSQSIKNILLCDKNVDFQTLFSSMSQCKSLENVHIFDKSLHATNISNPTIFFNKCVNLYCLYIYASYNNSAKRKNLLMLQNVNAACQKHVTLKILPNSDFIYDPYTSVFHLSYIKKLN